MSGKRSGGERERVKRRGASRGQSWSSEGECTELNLRCQWPEHDPKIIAPLPPSTCSSLLYVHPSSLYLVRNPIFFKRPFHLQDSFSSLSSISYFPTSSSSSFFIFFQAIFPNPSLILMNSFCNNLPILIVRKVTKKKSPINILSFLQFFYCFFSLLHLLRSIFFLF